MWKDTRQTDSIRLESIDELIWSCYSGNNYDSALYWANQQVAFARRCGNGKFVGIGLSTIGSIYDNLSRHVKALEYHELSTHVRDSIGDISGVAASLSNTGRSFFMVENFDKAIEYYFRALKLREKSGDKKSMATVLGNIGNTYLAQKDYNKAGIYLNRGLELMRESKNKHGIALALSNLGIVERKKGNAVTAICYLKDCVHMYDSLHNSRGYTGGLVNLCNVYQDLKNYAAADSCARLSLSIREKMKDSLGLISSYFALALNYSLQGENSSCISLAQKALSIATKLGNLSGQFDAANLLYKTYKKTGNAALALEMLEISKTASDSITTINSGKKHLVEQVRYDYEKKMQNDSLLTLQKQQQILTALQAEKQTKRISLLVLVFVLVIVAVSSYYYFRSSKQQKIIADQKSNLLQQKLLIAQINPHFFFNSLNAVQHYIYQNEKNLAGEFLSRFAALMRNILEFSRENWITIDEEVSFLKEYFALQQLRFAKPMISSIETDPGIDTEQTMIPPMLLQPFVENAIEHGLRENGGEVIIRLRSSNGKIIYEIEDNGIGLTAAAAKKESKHKSRAIAITEERLETFFHSGKPEISFTEKTIEQHGSRGLIVSFPVPFLVK